MTFTRLKQRGDTILEVLICVAVLSFILAAAFTLSNRNQVAARQAQERAEAVKLAESQLELLRSFADLRQLPHQNPYNQDYFCLFNDTDPATGPGIPTAPSPSPDTGIKLIDFTAGNPSNDRANDTFNNYPDECNPPGESGNEGFYNIAVWSPGVPVSGINGTSSVYGVTVRWDSANGNERDEVKMFYAVYDTNNPLYATAPSPACSDGIDNDGDGQVNWPQDPDCNNNPNDNSENNPAAPPPPPPQPPANLSWVRKGGEFISCTPNEPAVNDGADGCFTANGRNIPNVGDMWARRAVAATYSFLGPNGVSQVSSGPSTLQIKYKEYTDLAPAPAGYSYRIGVYLGVGSGPNYVLRGTFDLPAGSPGAERDFSAPINIQGGASTIRLVWENNAGVDPDLSIVELRIENADD